jgi:ketosteroid isomerase-like protein
MRRSAVCLIWTITSGMSLAQDDGGSSAADAPSDSTPNAAQEEIHEQLRALRERMFSAYKERDMDALLTDVASDVVITWQNADRNRGHDEFRQFYDRMMNGENGVVKDISSTFEVDDLSLLYGSNTAVACGTLSDEFTLNDGSHFSLNSKWTSTIVRQDEQWKVASFHVSANIFDNPILDVATGWLLKASLGGGLLGLVIGLLIGRATKRPATTA